MSYKHQKRRLAEPVGKKIHWVVEGIDGFKEEFTDEQRARALTKTMFIYKFYRVELIEEKNRLVSCS